MIKGREGIEQILDAIGCLGCWEIDWYTEKVRNTGQLAELYGLTSDQASSGVDLRLTDRVFHPDDLDEVRRARKSRDAVTAGRRVMRFRALSADGRNVWLESHGQVSVNRYGALTRSHGIVLDVTTLRQEREIRTESAASLVGLDHLSASLVQAYRGARDLGLSEVQAELKPVVMRVFHLLGRRFRQAKHH